MNQNNFPRISIDFFVIQPHITSSFFLFLMTLTLYTAPTGNGRKPLVFLKLLNIPHELHLFSWPTKDIKQDWYLKLNPQGLVPTLVDGELILPESNAILQYLAETYDKQGKFSYNLQTDPLEYWQQQNGYFIKLPICWYFV